MISEEATPEGLRAALLKFKLDESTLNEMLCFIYTIYASKSLSEADIICDLLKIMAEGRTCAHIDPIMFLNNEKESFSLSNLGAVCRRCGVVIKVDETTKLNSIRCPNCDKE